ncbi:AraC family transcriptional regulator [Clostridium sp. OS1-26]|uniref:helix-turn-helix transcriptional regulator n=1 Tax=Clostridium sp. OS1-26 TaxID=3070681 RepID=UPI0027DEFDAB|nr:AraC family transcriptional regulator [Clostridium sp. OS1-26]WML34415.1 AraC family transcriptional regulator [Clostridium sp. OS1-26]
MLLEGYDSNNQSCTEIVAQYIKKHFQENITLENLAQIVHLSPTYLSRVFHQEKGVAIRTYISQQRMEQSKYLLLHSNLPIKKIAEDCGFINISHFYRVFKKYIGKSPADIRKGRS